MITPEGFDTGTGNYVLGSFQGGPDPNAGRDAIAQSVMSQQGMPPPGPRIDFGGLNPNGPSGGGGMPMPQGGGGAYPLGPFQGGPDMNNPANSWMAAGPGEAAFNRPVGSSLSGGQPGAFSDFSGFNSGNAMPGFGIPGDAGIPGSGAVPGSGGLPSSGFSPSNSFVAEGPAVGSFSQGGLTQQAQQAQPSAQPAPTTTPQPSGGVWPSGNSAQVGPNLNDAGDRAALAAQGGGDFAGFGGFSSGFGGGWGGGGFAGSGFSGSGDYSGGYDTAAGTVG
jgi:hypothetical protein